MNGKTLNEDNLRFAIFLLALWGSLWSFSSGINQRIDSLEDRLTHRIGNLENKMDTKFDAIDTRLDSFGERIAANEAKIGAKE
ncbi:MAG: hypothetical protein J4F39_11710 [Candidatus Latescibacteria bacterium]|nr:hypothetical protein [Candidatus Latescibacterota bacterium]